MATYSVTTANWNDPAFWSSISQGTAGHTLDFSALPASYSVFVDRATGTITLSDGATTFVVGEAGYGGTADATLGGTTLLSYFTGLTGSAGNDTLWGTAGNDTLSGGAGDDILRGGTGNDRLLGGDGADTILLENNFDRDTIYGGEGGTDSDRVDLTSVTGAVTVDYYGNEQGIVTDGLDTVTFYEIESFTLTGQADFLTAGADSLGIWADLGAGDDTAWTGLGADTVYGADGADEIYGDAGNDSIEGGTGNDNLGGDAGDDTVRGGAGDDYVEGDTGNDLLSGGTGNDSILGGADADTIQIEDGFGTDTILGGETATTGSDNDAIDLSALTGPVSVTATGVEAGTVTDGTDTLTFTQVERLILTDFDDTVTGTGDTVGIEIAAGAGNDSLLGGSGADTLEGGAGDDTVIAGAGGDYIDDEIGAGNGTGNDWIDGGADSDTVYSGIGDDTIIGGSGDDLLAGEEDADTFLFYDGFGNDLLFGSETTAVGTDYDRMDLSNLTGSVTVTYGGFEYGTFTDAADTVTFYEIEALTLTNQADSVDGSADMAGLDIDGLDGNDTLIGGQGADSLVGGNGADMILGGAGDDTIDGGSGPATPSYTEQQGTATNAFTGTLGGTDFTGNVTSNETVLWTSGPQISGGYLLGNGDGNETHTHTFSREIAGARLRFDYLLSTETVTLRLDGQTVNLNTAIANGDVSFDGDGLYTIDGAGRITSTTSDPFVALNHLGVLTINTAFTSAQLQISGTGDGMGYEFLVDTNAVVATSADVLDGGDDADTFLIGDGFGKDTITGGEGGTDDDLIDASGLTGPVTVTYTGNEAGWITDGTDTLTFSGIERIILSDDADYADARASSVAAEIEAGAGNDTVYGTDGGADTILGGDGDDFIDGWAADDSIEGGAGNDSLYGGSANDFVSGGDGNDTLDGFTENDTLRGDAGNDLLTGGSGDDSLDGGTGADTLAGGTGADTILGGDDADRIVVEDGFGNDSIWGGEGGTDADTLDLSAVTADLDFRVGGTEWGNVTVGTDTLKFWEIEDFILGQGDDQLSFGTNSTVALWADGQAGNDTLLGSSYDDTFIGGEGDDRLYGNGGADSLVGDAGQDSVYAGAGDDTVYAGEGSDLVDGGDGADYINTRMPVGTGLPDIAYPGYYDADTDPLGDRDTVYGGIGNDTILTGDDADLVYGGDDNDSIEGGFDADTLFGDEGNDTVIGGEGSDLVEGGGGDDFLVGGYLPADAYFFDMPDAGDAVTDNDRDTILGGDGNDTIYGYDDADSLSGDDGQDVLFGGADDDTLTGGLGDDALTGGEGDDTFVYLVGDGADTIADFNAGASGTLDDGIATNNDFIDLTGFYDNLQQLYADQADDGVLNQSNTLDAKGRAVDYSDNDQFSGGSLTFTNATADSSFYTAENTGVVCFAAGTLILTPAGEVPVETLRPGDAVVTRDNGVQPIAWVAARRLDAAQLARARGRHPVILAPALTGAHTALTVSPQHGILLPGPGGDEVLVRAAHLARLKGGMARVARGCRGVTYVHLMFEAHQIVFANGAPSESFYPGPQAVGALDGARRAELAALFPALLTAPPDRAYGPTARPFARFCDLPPRLADLRAG